MRKIVLLILSVICCRIVAAASPSADSASVIPRVPLTLESAIEIGLKNNPDIKSACSRITAARGRFRNSISPPPTEVSVSFDDIPHKQKINAYSENAIGVSQSFEFPSKYVIRGAKYRKEEDISRHAFAQVKRDVVSRIKSSYYNALALKSQIDIAEENLQIAEQFLKKAEIRCNAGEGTNLEKLTAGVQYSEALNNIRIQKNHYSTALTELNYAMGNCASANKEYQLSDSLVYITYDLNIDNLLEQSSQSNPGLIVSKLQADVLSSEKSLALSSLLPDLNIGAYAKKVTDDNQRYYGVSFGFTLPLWFMFDQHGRISEASANLSAAQAELNSAKNSNHLQIKRALDEFMDAQRQLIYYRNDILPQAGEVYRSASRSYESGEITYIEFLEAQKTIIDARSKYVDALLAYNISVISIEQAIGKNIQ